MYKGGSYPSCERAFLGAWLCAVPVFCVGLMQLPTDAHRITSGESMPVPELPHSAVLEGDSVVDGVDCYHWTLAEFSERVHVYVSKATRGTTC